MGEDLQCLQWFFGGVLTRIMQHFAQANVVIKRQDTAENNHRVNIVIFIDNTYYEAIDTLNGLIFKIWAENRFSLVKLQGSPEKLGKFSYLGQIDLKKETKMTAMDRFIYNL